MQFIWDNLAAVVITSTVVLLLLASRERMLEANIEQTANSYVRVQSTAFAGWLEENLLEMGNRLSDENPLHELTDSTYTVITPDSTGTIEVTKRFIFKQKVQDPADTTQTIVQFTKYEMEFQEYRLVEKDSIPIFRLTREAKLDKPGETYQIVGESPTLISYFRVEMMDQCGRTIPTTLSCNGETTITTAPEQCTPDGVPCDSDDIFDTRVRFAMVTPFDTNRETLKEVYYGSTLLLPFDE